MDLLTALLACSVYTSDDALVRAIAQSNSHGNQFSVLDANAETSDDPRPAEPRSVEVAMARLEDVRSAGDAPLLGWMQLPPDWVTMYGREMREAFDPCVNISIGTAMLSEFDYECAAAISMPTAHAPPRGKGSPSRKSAAERRHCVIRKYGEALGMTDFALVTTLELGHQPPARDHATADSPVIGPDVANRWGANRVLFSTIRDGSL